MSWRLAKSLEVLREQVNAMLPKRDKSSDGSIGDASHASRSSDHNPWVKDGAMGVVTAIDITHDPKGGFDSYKFADHLKEARDPRVKYIISNRRISNPTIANGAWRTYSGSNPHDHHVHISVSEHQALYDSVKPWDTGVLVPGRIDGDGKPVERPTRPLLRLGSTGEDVSYLQRMLGLPVTGVFDEATDKTVREFQRKFALVMDGKVGGYTWRQLEGLSVRSRVIWGYQSTTEK